MLYLVIKHLFVALLAVFLEPKHVLFDLLPKCCRLRVGQFAFTQRFSLFQLFIDALELHLHFKVLQLFDCGQALSFVIFSMLSLNRTVDKVIAACNDRFLD